MEPLIIEEQNVINSICLYVAEKNNVLPEEIQVELYYDDEEEDLFIAEAFVNEQQVLVSVREMITALRRWIDQYEDIDSIAAGIELDFNETDGIFAKVR